MRANEFIIEGVAGPKKCWPGHRKVGTQPGTGKNKGKRVNDCEKIKKESVAEATGDEQFDTMMGGITSRGSLDTREALALMRDLIYNGGASYEEALQQASASFEISPSKLNALYNNQGVAEGLTPDQMFDIIEEMVEHAAAEHGVDPELIWEELESVDDIALFESAAWRRKEGKNKKGGLNAKGVASYRRENPGSKLQTAVTTKPSKLKKGSKAAKRRKSFCARMGGVKGPMKKDGKPTRKALALRKWNC